VGKCVSPAAAAAAAAVLVELRVMVRVTGESTYKGRYMTYLTPLTEKYVCVVVVAQASAAAEAEAVEVEAGEGGEAVSE